MTSPLYLDNHATTPLDPRVQAAMVAFWESGAANPHSASHAAGWQAREAVDRARADIAALVGATPDCVVFTSGASEANNLAILGSLNLVEGGHLICSSIEHPSVMQVYDYLRGQGFALDLLPVDDRGLVDPQGLAALLREDTRLVSVMAANNEIGTLQPIAELSTLCRAAGVPFHCDAAQAFGKVALDFSDQGPDLMSITAHKVYGPMGIGALLVRPGLSLRPLFHGGRQERGLRPGTVPAALAVGFGKAAALAGASMESESVRLRQLRKRLLIGLRDALPGLRLYGDEDQRLPGNLSLAWPGLPAEEWILACPGLAFSSGSACASGENKPSPVMAALGLSVEEAAETIRIGLGRQLDEAAIDEALRQLVAGALTAKQSL